MNENKINHYRYNGFNHNEPELVGLTDCVQAMSDRATAVLSMLKLKFTSDEDELIWSALDSIDQEVKDIKAAMTCYYGAVEFSEENADESSEKSPE